MPLIPLPRDAGTQQIKTEFAGIKRKQEELKDELEKTQEELEELTETTEKQAEEITTLREEAEERELLIKNHKHQGLETPELNINDIIGELITVSTAPSATPLKKITKQIYVYRSGATKRLYIYDFTAGSWYYCALS